MSAELLARTTVHKGRIFQLEIDVVKLPTGHTVDMEQLPAKAAQVDGIAWLPRIIAKARAKLRGEMPPDLMYDCGGDRDFLERARRRGHGGVVDQDVDAAQNLDGLIYRG